MDKIYVLGRDQITRLHDLNNDGEADFYENFNNDTVVTPNYHEFCLDLQTDSKGNFYFSKGSPWTPDCDVAASGHAAQSLQGRLEARSLCDRLPRAERQGHGAARRNHRERQSGPLDAGEQTQPGQERRLLRHDAGRASRTARCSATERTLRSDPSDPKARAVG